MKDMLFVKFNEANFSHVTTELHVLMMNVKSADTIPMSAVYTRLCTGNFPDAYRYAEEFDELPAIPPSHKYSAIQLFLAPKVAPLEQARTFQIACLRRMLSALPEGSHEKARAAVEAAEGYMEADLLQAFEGHRASLEPHIAKARERNANVIPRVALERSLGKDLRLMLLEAAIGLDALQAAGTLFFPNTLNASVQFARRVVGLQGMITALNTLPYESVEKCSRELFQNGWNAEAEAQFELLKPFGNPFEETTKA